MDQAEWRTGGRRGGESSGAGGMSDVFIWGSWRKPGQSELNGALARSACTRVRQNERAGVRFDHANTLHDIPENESHFEL
jgi:hypothetical protein